MTITAATDRLAGVQAEIARTSKENGRDPAAVTLVAVTKTFGAETIEPVLAAGQRVFGENRVQEAKGKWPALRERYPDLELHLIGPLQSNKAKEAVALFDVIHTVDRESLCAALGEGDRAAGPTSEAAGRGQYRRRAAEGGGAAAGRPMRSCVRAARLTGSSIAGLMCIPPFDEAPAPHFALLAKIAKSAMDCRCCPWA